MLAAGNRPSGRTIRHQRHHQIDHHRGQRPAEARRGAFAQIDVEQIRQEGAARRYRPARRASAAIKAPRIEPMPPMVTTTNAAIKMFSPMPICTVRIGACISPAKPASAAPRPKISVYKELDIDAERADHFAIGSAGADQHAEPRAHDQDVEEERHRERYPDDDEAIERIEQAGKDLHGVSISLGSDSVRPAGPQISRTSSLKNSRRPKVPSTWSRWLRA